MPKVARKPAPPAPTTTTSYSWQAFIQLPLVELALWLMIYALFFHLCHGVRHLFWDSGETYDKLLMNYYIILELFGSVALTGLSFLFVQMGV
jgi:succinate dehydrogenase / fumarate reductase cytochrome b subunit